MRLLGLSGDDTDTGFVMGIQIFQMLLVVSNCIFRPIWNEMVCLLKSEGCDRIELVKTTTILFVTCYKSGGRNTLSFWKGKYISQTLLLTNIPCLINMISVHGAGQIAMKLGLVLSLSLKTDVWFSFVHQTWKSSSSSWPTCCHPIISRLNSFFRKYTLSLKLGLNIQFQFIQWHIQFWTLQS